jgi:probable DNA metabolism protein
MRDYLYDGTFEGLLTCIHHHYYTDKASGIFNKNNYQANMLTESMIIETEPDKATVVYEAILNKISPYDLRRVYRVFLSEEPEKEMKILRYVVLGFKVGSSISMLHGNPIVFDVQAIEKKIFVEKERMLQFVRFSVTEDGVLYSQIEPDNDVLELLHVHFCDRFKNDPFIIHDVKRNKAMVAYQKNWYICDFTSDELPKLSDEEVTCRKLWKNYFENIAIKERTNPKCQRRSMPVRYWKHLTEMM